MEALSARDDISRIEQFDVGLSSVHLVSDNVRLLNDASGIPGHDLEVHEALYAFA